MNHAASPPDETVLALTAQRYRSGSRFTRHYVAAKLRRDPVHREILARGRARPLGRVIDLGAGYGQLGVALLVAGLAESVLAIDLGAAKLEEAVRAGAGLAVTTRIADLAQPITLPQADTVLIIDVLYQLSTPAQRALLAAATAAAPCVLIRTQDPRRGVRSWFARGLEVVLRRFWPTSGTLVNPLPVEQIQSCLSNMRFNTEITPCWGRTGLANVMLEGRAQEEAALLF